MFQKSKAGYYVFSEFNRWPNLLHGFSTREFGNMQAKFLKSLGSNLKSLVLMEQVHGRKIKVVRDKDGGKIIPGVDGIITNRPGLVLGVRTADCLPILFFESEAKIVGVAHAGWRGILARLPQKMIDQMIRMGGLLERIWVAIGPHICRKCYPVERSRSAKFVSEFGKLEEMIQRGKKADFLDLEIPTRNQLIHSGILAKNIFTSGLCTSCQNEEFFSYRKNKAESYGEMLSVIYLK